MRILMLLLISFFFNMPARGTPVAVNGILDLRGQQLEQVFDLRGDWEFYWNKHLTPAQIAKFANVRVYTKVPASWYQDKRSDFSVYGYGTYRLSIQIDQVQQLAVNIPEIWSSSRIFLDGQEIAAYGNLGPDIQSYQGGTGMTYRVFTPKSTVFELLIQVSNYDIFLSGITLMPRIGNSSTMQVHRDRLLAVDIFVIGSLFIMGIYHLCLFAQRTEDASTFWFALVCFFVMSYTATTGAEVLITAWHGISFDWRLRIFNFSWMAATHAFVWFSYELYKPYFKLKIAKIAAGMAISHHLAMLIFSVKIFMKISVIMQIFVAPILIYTCWVAWQASREKRSANQPFLWGILILSVTVINDMLTLKRVIDTPVLAGAGLFLFTVLQSYLLANRFSVAFVKLRNSEQENRKLGLDLKIERDNVLALNENLELTVEHKTREIRSIMEHIPLGIFTMSQADGSIERDYSRHLGQIFSQDNLAGMKAPRLLFANSQLSVDEQSQAESAIVASLGETDINFEINSRLLPLEIRRSDRAGTVKSYDLTWNAIVNDRYQVEKILVTIRDDSELKILQIKAQAHQDELELLGEILSVNPAQFNHFMSSCRELLAENNRLIERPDFSSRDLDALRTLFINTHTLKGAARALYFKRMTHVLHEAEQYYSLLKNDPMLELDLSRVKREIGEINRVADLYENIAANKLGVQAQQRSDFILEEAQRNYSVLLQIEEQSELSIEVQRLVSSHRKRLFDQIYRSVRSIMEDILGVLPSLARDLHKSLPTVDLRDQGLYANPKAKDLLHKIFGHILRNSMDHGLEHPEASRNHLSSPVPSLSIEFRVLANTVLVLYGDSGRGLNLGRIREIALRNGWISQEGIPPESLAELLLDRGFSTANEVTEISGRGVGLSAVKQYLLQAGGTLNIKLLSPRQTDPDFCPFLFEMTLPAQLFSQPFPEIKIQVA